MSRMLGVSVAVTASAPRRSHRSRLLFGRAKDSAIASGAESGFSAPLLSQRTARTLPSSVNRENRSTVQLRMPRPPRRLFIIGFLIFLFAVIISFVVYTQEAKAPHPTLRLVTAALNGHTFDLEVADDPVARVKGLAGRDRLNEGEGMLFVFDAPDIECFWMKDVNFPIDIFWFDSEKRLIHHISNLSPETYPNSFCPPSPSQYVVELPAGTIEKLSIEHGDTLTVENL